MKGLLTLLLFSCCSLFGWSPQFEVDSRLGSYREGAGALIWAPLCQRCDRVAFVQGQAGNYRDLWTGNLGLGYRQLFRPNWAWGLNAFGDVSYSPSGHTYGQGSVGAELLGKCWEGRINGYFTKNQRHLIREVDIEEGGIIINGNDIEVDYIAFLKEERTYTGFDAELGRGICFEHGQLWGYAGYYYFHNHGVKDIQGPRLRLEYQLDNPLCWEGTRLTVGGEFDYDPVHKVEGSLLISFRIALCERARRTCCPCQNSCLSVCRQMGNRVRREPTVWVERLDRSEFRHDVLAQIFFVDGTNTLGAGTQIDPTTLQDAVDRASNGDFIFLLNVMNLPISSGAGILVMKPDQTVIGFGDAPSTAIDFGPFGTLTITDLNPPPHRATLVGDAGSTLITLADRATVRGIQLDGMAAAAIGIAGTNADDILLYDLDTTTFMGIRDFTTAGIALNGGSQPTINRVTVSTIATGNGISLTNTAGALLDLVGVMNAAMGDGILFSGGSKATLRNVSVDTVLNQAVAFEGVAGASIFGLSLTGAAANWLLMDGCSGTFSFTGLTILGGTPTDAGIRIANNSAATTFIASTLDQSGGDGVRIESNSASIDLTGLIIDYTGVPTTAALFVQESSGPVRFSHPGLRITGGTLPAIFLDSSTGLVSIDLAEINMIGSTGRALAATDMSNLQFTGASIEMQNTAAEVIQLVNTSTDGAITFSDLMIDVLNVGTRIIDIQAVDSSNLTFALNDSTFTAVNTLAGVRVFQSGMAAGASVNATVDGLTSTIAVAGAQGHIVFLTDSAVIGGNFTGSATGNTFGGMGNLTGGSTGISVLLGGDATADVTVQNYRPTDQDNAGAGIDVEFDFSTPSSVGNVLIASNNIADTLGSNGINIVGLTTGVGRGNVVVTGNTYVGTGIAFQGTAVAGFGGILCNTFTGNSASSATGMNLTRTAGTYILTPSNTAPGLASANPGITGTITITGTTQTQSTPCVASCALLEDRG
ncbi:MAG: inverse autotransporter beta domain-containing protein [Parachlamydiales bacterium]